jgi:hypothetical protein
MKKFLLISLSILFVQVVYAQDIIIKVSGDEVKVKVLEITPDKVLYHAPDSVNGKRYSLNKADVFMIRFANGTKEVFKENLQPLDKKNKVAYNPEQMYKLGQEDARKYYKGNGAMWGSAASMFAPLPGGPIIIAAVRPKVHAGIVPSAELLQSSDYVEGYEKQAHKRKIGKSAVGAGIGLGLLSTLLILMMNAPAS